MGKIIETLIDRFDGGMVNDPLEKRGETSRILKNFDISSSKRLCPYRDSEDGDAASSTSKKQNFCLALQTGTTWNVYALGVKSGTGLAEVTYKNRTTGGSNDLSDSSWTQTANYQAGAGATKFDLFVYYKRTGLIYGAQVDKIWAYDPSGVAAFDDNVVSTDGGTPFSFTNIAQGLVHSKDDRLYIPYDNKIAKNENGSWTEVAITIPEQYKINSICEYGNYLAIAAAPLSGIGNSRVYLWDRDTSLETLSENIDWEAGELKILEEVDGNLMGISISTGAHRFNDKVTFRYLSGTKARKFDEIIASGGNASTLGIIKQKIDSRVFFLLKTEVDDVTLGGVWSFGRSHTGDNFTVVHERTHDNDNALTNVTLQAFYLIGDFTFISYVDVSTYTMSKTNDTSSYTATSIYEKRLNSVDSAKIKELKGVSVLTEAMPTAGQIVLKYKKDDESSFTTIFTSTTDGGIRHSASNLASGDNLPIYKEITYRIESTGGAEVTGLKTREEIIDDEVY